jgi:hypothetical protein
MTSTNIYKEIKPTYLCIKQHSITKKKYFCKTTKPDPIKYLGSGTYWNDHINKHGKQFVETIWLSDLYTDTSISEHALHFSAENNIVESDAWANLKPENGLDGGTSKGSMSDDGRDRISKSRTGNSPWNKGVPMSEEQKKILSIANTGTIRSEESKQKQSNSTSGIPKSEDHKSKISAANKGQIPYSKGKPMSEEQKKLISIANKGKPSLLRGIPKITVICPHCNKIGAGGSMVRWHFDKCKLFQPSST